MLSARFWPITPRPISPIFAVAPRKLLSEEFIIDRIAPRLCRPMCGGGFAPPSLALYFQGYAREGRSPRKSYDSSEGHRPSAHQMAQPFPWLLQVSRACSTGGNLWQPAHYFAAKTSVIKSLSDTNPATGS